MGTTPQREALFRAMFHAVIRELVPKKGVEEDIFMAFISIPYAWQSPIWRPLF
jgi:hypothetical protein